MAKLSVTRAISQAESLIKKGDFQKAEKLYQEILRVFPQNKKAQKALASLNRPQRTTASSAPPQEAIHQLINFYNKGDFETVIEKANTLAKQYPSAFMIWNILGAANKGAGKIQAAAASFKKVILLNPTYAEGFNNLGVILKEQDKLDEALSCYDKALLLKPNYAEAYNNRGITLKDMGKLDEALTCFNKALSLKPDYTDVYNNMGIALKDLRNFERAIACFKKALSLKPDYAEVYNNMSVALKGQLKLDEAIEASNRAIDLKPDYAEAHGNLGASLQEQGKLEGAIAAYRKALSFKSDLAEARAQKLYLQGQMCDWDELKGELLRLADLGIHGEEAPPLCFVALEDHPFRHRLRSENFAKKRFMKNAVSQFVVPGQKPKRLRIGYFSADFKEHPVSYLLAKVIEAHDRDCFEVYGYSIGKTKDDQMKRRLSKGFDVFREVHSLSDRDVALLAKQDGIDIAVDLMGYTQHSRTGIFLLRAAPVQINYLGFPGTLGVETMDYIIVDQNLVPREKQKYYSEKPIYLPHQYLPTDNTRQLSSKPITRSDEGLPENGFVFCCFNNNYKISPKEFDIWMRLLRKIDDSVLWLRKSNKWSVKNFCKEAKKRGIDETRLIFADKLPIDEHLARHKLADVFLDTFAFNAHTTATEALWAGLPVVTKLGEGFAARVSGSLLSAIGLPELITNNEVEYEKLALELATNSEKLSSIKHRLAVNRSSKPLFNTEQYTKHLEDGYQRAYQRYFEGNKPKVIHVPE